MQRVMYQSQLNWNETVKGSISQQYEAFNGLEFIHNHTEMKPLSVSFRLGRFMCNLW